MNLVIVESPTKEKTISRFLDKNYTVRSSYGHVRDLPKGKLGIQTDSDFSPEYVVIKKAQKMINALKALVSKADTVFMATDYDREGEAIAWHLSQVLGLNKSKIKRITFHEITKDAIKDALKNPREIDISLVNAQQARRILDRLVGYKLSPLLWKKVARGLSAGRVQSVALRLVVERENEIKNFVSRQYWTISVKLSKGEEEFTAELISKNNKRFQEQIVFDLFAEKYKVNVSTIATGQDADLILSELKPLAYRVEDVQKKKISRTPPPPFTTSTMQQDAARKLGFFADKTMKVAQSLYEGVGIEDGNVGLITYHRTDSVSVAKVSQEEARKFISEKAGKEYLPEKIRMYKTKTKGAQEAHECIRPTGVYHTPESIEKYLTGDQKSLYKLIWQRFVASQMAEAVYDSVMVDISAGEYMFRAGGRTLLFPGYLKLYKESDENSGDQADQSDQDGAERILPALDPGDNLRFLEAVTDEHATSPPPRYNEASLIKTLEKHGIGRPSTYATISGTILRRRYVRSEDRKFFPTDLGAQVNDILKAYFEQIVDINFTAGIEEKLDEIADGTLVWQDVIREFYNPFQSKLDIAENSIAQKPKPELTDRKCPVCSTPMYLRTSRFGKFYSCSKWPSCKGKQNA
ncbi:MAG: type I DNA topoisomerase [Elusimicrobiota bacterium]